jgi:hypothetical protein
MRNSKSTAGNSSKIKKRIIMLSWINEMEQWTQIRFSWSKQIKNYTETDKNKEFRTKIFESVIEAAIDC